MDEEELKKKKLAAFELGQPLDEISVDELSDTITLLHEEIARLEQAKKEKTNHLSAAEALFKQ